MASPNPMRSRRDRPTGDGRVIGPPRRGSALFIGVVAIGIIAISVALVRSQVARGAAVEAAQPAQPAVGAATVRSLASVLPEPELPADVRVAVVRDPASAGWYDDAAALDEVLEWWRSSLETFGADARIVAPDDPAVRSADVLVLASQPCLGPAARRAIDQALAGGRGVVATWLTGTRDEGCAAVGWSLATRLSGAMRLDTLETRDAVYVTIPGDATLGSGIPPGSRLELLAGNVVAARVPGRDILYSDRAMNPAPAHGLRLVDAAAAQRQVGAARSVYLGFEPMRSAPTTWDRALGALVARNAVMWAAGRPIATVAAWPAGRTAAAMIAQDVEDQFENAAHAVDSLDAAGFRGTWFLVSDIARGQRALVRRLARNGEIGTHSENHQLLAGASEAEQARRLGTTQRDLAEVVGRPVAGLRPPEEQFDAATLRAWTRVGGQYLFGANDARTASPEVLAVGADTLVLLSRIINDDVISVRRAGRVEVGPLIREYENALEKVQALGGLYIMSYHSQFMSRPELVPVVAAVARRVNRDSSLWRATGSEIARWWRTRHGLEVSTAPHGRDWLRVIVANPARGGADSVVVRVVLPPGRDAVSIAGARSLPARAGEARLLFPRVDAGGVHAATLTLGATG